MKPKIFIGSSVEGLNIAYSIQQNLSHDAEINIWNQGVFELSKTTMESLMKILEDSDFGIFIFSEDDILTIREKTNPAIRDNVLFEFGLFIGKLGRERVFFIIPSDTELHLPTDLIGVTPGKFENKREDGNLQAATGPVSHQIRLQINKLGKRIEDEGDAKSPEKKEEMESQRNDWLQDFISRKFVDAKAKLKEIIKTEKDEDKKIELEIYSVYCELKENEIKGKEDFEKILKKHSSKLIANKRIAEIYLWEDYLDRAFEILSEALITFNNDDEIVKLLANYYEKAENEEKAIEFLNQYKPEDNPEIALKLSYLLEKNDELPKAREVIHKIYMKYSSNEEIKYRYARIALDLNIFEVALFLLKSLTLEFPDKSDYWGYLSNCAVQLDFNDLTLSSLRKAEELTESNAEWILSNIGNIFNNKGLYSEAISYLEKGLEINKNSEYAHNRLSSCMKKREEENKKIKVKRKDGLKLIREFEKEMTSTQSSKLGEFHP